MVIYTLWKNDELFDRDYEGRITSGNDEQKLLFPFPPEGKKVVPQQSGTTQDEPRYNESHEVLFPLMQT